MGKRPVILLTNDDGIGAPGLETLARALKRWAMVVIAAPDRERSAISRALSLHQIIRARELQPGRVSVEGTPADCVNYALFGYLKKHPDLVISGINQGPNLGDDIAYSGTVAAAAEAAAYGVPSLALSLAIGARRDFRRAARWGTRVARQLLRHRLPPRTYLNVNVPDCPGRLRGVKVTTVGARRYDNSFTTRCDPFGREYSWLGGGKPSWEPDPEADQDAIAAGYVSVTPITLDVTAHAVRDELREWRW